MLTTISRPTTRAAANFLRNPLGKKAVTVAMINGLTRQPGASDENAGFTGMRYAGNLFNAFGLFANIGNVKNLEQRANRERRGHFGRGDTWVQIPAAVGGSKYGNDRGRWTTRGPLDVFAADTALQSEADLAAIPVARSIVGLSRKIGLTKAPALKPIQ